MDKEILLSEQEISSILKDLTKKIVDIHKDFKNTALVGIQPRGAFVAKRIAKILKEDYQISTDLGWLDIAFFRDDFRQSQKTLLANSTEINFEVEGKNIIFIDDVLYTGRSIRAALTAVESFGRPNKIELLVMVDRPLSRHLPIQPDYFGKKVESPENKRIVFSWKETQGEDMVYLIEKR